jgi:hypothetical protein
MNFLVKIMKKGTQFLKHFILFQIYFCGILVVFSPFLSIDCANANCSTLTSSSFKRQKFFPTANLALAGWQILPGTVNNQNIKCASP